MVIPSVKSLALSMESPLLYPGSSSFILSNSNNFFFSSGLLLISLTIQSMSPSVGFPSFSKHFISVDHTDYCELNIFVAFHVKRLLFYDDCNNAIFGNPWQTNYCSKVIARVERTKY